MANLIQSFESLKNTGCRFISLNNYMTQRGEVADYLISVGINVRTAKEQDLDKLIDAPNAVLLGLASSSGLKFDFFKSVVDDMAGKLTKNLNADKSKRTAASQAQTNAYINIADGLSINRNTELIYIFGQQVKKNTIIEGDAKNESSNPAVIAKEMISEALDLRSHKFRRFILDSAEQVKMNGQTFEIFM